MPDLGEYAGEVLSAYAGSLVLLIGLIAISVWRARRVARRLADVEARRHGVDAPRSGDAL